MAPDAEAVNRAISAIAVEHGGHIHRLELVALGLSRHAIDHRVARGFLIAVFRSVYAVGHLATNPIDRAKGALLACGSEAALCENSSATLYGVWNEWSFPLHVIVPTDRRLKGVVIHRSTRLLPRDIRIVSELRVVSPALMLVQIAPQLTDKQLKRAIADLRFQKLLTVAQLDDTIARFARHPGVKQLRPVVAEQLDEPTRSGWEDDWLPFAARHDLPGYDMNKHICGIRYDVFFPAERLIVELDGWGSHQTFEAFQKDREDPAKIYAATGIPTIRITHTQLTRHPRAQADRLLVILERRRRELAQLGGG